MKLYKKIDNYLLHHFPNIWITRIHVFLPIGLVVMAIVYLINVYVIGWDVSQNIPDYTGVPTLIIPVLIFLIAWFVYQSRYNVEKSGGKLSILGEYFNYFIYFLVFSTALLLVTSIDYTNDVKVLNTINDKEFVKDIKNLNRGNSVMNYPGELIALENGNYLFPNKMMIDNNRFRMRFFDSKNYTRFNLNDKAEFGFENSFKYSNKVSYYVISTDKEDFKKNNYNNIYYKNVVNNYPENIVYDTVEFFSNSTHRRKYCLSKEEFDEKILAKEIFKYSRKLYKYDNEYVYDDYYQVNQNEDNYYFRNEFTEVSKLELEKIITNYKNSYNKFVTSDIYIDAKAEGVISSNLKGVSVNELFYSKGYNGKKYFYNKGYVKNKVDDMSWVFRNNYSAFYYNYFDGGIYKVFLIFLLYLALLVWIFKQIKWRSYMFGLISLALTPMVFGLISFIFHQLFRVKMFSIGFVLFLYLVVFIKVFLGYNSKRKNKSSIVFAMYLQFFLPLLPIIILFFMESFYRKHKMYDYLFFENWYNTVYWSGLILGLLSIMIFKPIYKKMSLLPNNK